MSNCHHRSFPAASPRTDPATHAAGFPGAAQHEAKRNDALQTRDRHRLGICYNPGSAAHRFTLHRIRETGIECYGCSERSFPCTVSEPSSFSVTSTPLPRSQAMVSARLIGRRGSAAGASPTGVPAGSAARAR